VDESSPGAAAREAVAPAMQALDGAEDPREAVIAAHAAMEQTLAAHGVARLCTEAPREYLRRVLLARSRSSRSPLSGCSSVCHSSLPARSRVQHGQPRHASHGPSSSSTSSDW
jgi:hypothetical protein